MWIFDAHLDLSLNALDYNRDLRRPMQALREGEEGMRDYSFRGKATVCFPEMLQGEVGLCAATLIAPCSRPENPVPGWNSPEQSWAHIQGQRAWYQEMIDQKHLNLVHDSASLIQCRDAWNSPEGKPDCLSFLLSLEGADPLATLGHLERLTEQGLRALGPAHYGNGRYAGGTGSTNGFPQKGLELLKEMDRLGLILDATHLSDACFWEAIDRYQGPIWASHNNCRSLVGHQRQFSDEQLKILIQRGAAIGCVLDAWMMIPGWKKGTTTPEQAGVGLSHLIDHMDHICQLAGNARHVGIGSDLDGGFGLEQTAKDLNTIADLQRLPAMMEERGYSKADVENVMHGNFVNFLESAWS